MSEKNRDNKNRWRNVTIAFRMSPEENEELDLRVKLCGYQTRQVRKRKDIRFCGRNRVWEIYNC